MSTKADIKRQMVEALGNVLNKPYDAEDVMAMMLMAQVTMYSDNMESWEFIEDIIEEVFGERPEWHESKRRLREIK